MKKLKLLKLNSEEVLKRSQLKNIVGSSDGYYCWASTSSSGDTHILTSGPHPGEGSANAWCNFWVSAGYSSCSCHTAPINPPFGGYGT